MASVGADDVRDVINVSSVEVPDIKVLKKVRRAEVALELETGREIDYSNFLDASAHGTQLSRRESICSATDFLECLMLTR